MKIVMRDGRVFQGTALQIVKAMQDIAFGVEDFTVPKYIEWVVANARKFEEVELDVKGETLSLIHIWSGARTASRTAWSSSGGPSATTSRISARETRPRSSRTRAPRARERGGIGGASAGLQPPPTAHLRGTSRLFQAPENTCEISVFGLARGANGSLYVLTRRARGSTRTLSLIHI